MLVRSYSRNYSFLHFLTYFMLNFTLFGFPVSVHWMFWVISALLGGGIGASTPEELQGLLIWVLAVFLSVLIHELGHAFLMRRYGARAKIVLYSFGGLAIPDRGFNRQQDILVSLAGPFFQFVCGMLMKQLLEHSSGDAVLVQLFFQSFWEISILWSLFNLLPIYPFDGGHVLNAVLGPANYRLTLILSILCAVFIALFVFAASSNRNLAAMVPWPFNRYLHPFNALILGSLAFSNFQRLRGQRPNSFMQP